MSRIKYLIISLICLLFISCTSKPRGEHDIYIGTITGPETKLVETAKKVAEQQYGLHLHIITFEDYIVPNTALADHEIDANMFQHQPYLDVVLEKKKYPLVSIGKMFVYPMGVYSIKHKHISQIPDGSTIGIPNDPSNAARALRLLAQAKLITIPEKLNDLELTPGKIQSNPHHLVIKEIPAAQLPRVLRDLDAAVINTNYAVQAGLKLNKDAIFIEGSDSPYANIVVIRKGEEHQEKYQQLMLALHSPEVLAQAKHIFGDQAIPAWK